jgi:CHAT domain-containing protein/tetratricopeptide (TPR) repeat protein
MLPSFHARRAIAFFASVAFVVMLGCLVSAAPGAAAPTRASQRAALERSFEAAMKAGRFSEAATLGDSVVRVRESREGLKPIPAATVLDSLGRRLFLAGTPEAWAAAEPMFRGALARREKALGPDDPSVATSCATIATLLDYLGRWSDALPLAERAVTIREKRLGPNDAATAASLRQLGLLHFRLGDYAAASAPLERSLAIYQGLGAGYEGKIADGHNNLGELSRVRDQLDSAETHFRLGLEAGNSLPQDDPVRFGLTNNLAGLYKDLGRYDEAEPLLESGLATIERSADPGTIATARLNLAEVQRLQGRPEEAVVLYRKSLEGARAALGPAHPDLVPFLNQTAVCEQAVGRYARAESLYLETGSIVAATLGPEHPLVAQNLGDLATLRIAEGRAVEADTLLGRAIALRERTLGQDHLDVALLLVERARVRAPRDPAVAASWRERAIRILDAGRAYPDARLDAYAQRAEWQASRGRRDLAIADMTVALAAMDSLRAWRGGGDETRAAFVAGRLELVDRMVEWQLEQGDAGAALATHERARARVLLDQIVASGVDLRAGIPADVLGPLENAERTAEARLASAHRALEDTRSDPALAPKERLEALARLAARRDSAALDLALARRRIEDASPVWRAVLSSEGRIASVADLQRDVVPKDGVMLEYHVGEHASHLFVVPPRGKVQAFALTLDGEAAATLGAAPGPLGETTLERIMTGASEEGDSEPNPTARRDESLGIASLLSGVAAGGFVTLPLRTAAGPDSFELRLAALGRTLVPASQQKRLRSMHQAIVIPDGALHLLPFEALVTRPRSANRPTTYWLDDGPAIAYGPSATSLRSLALRARRAGEGRAEVLSVSNVAYAAEPDSATSLRRSHRWRPLPGTANETGAIRRAFGDANVEVLSGSDARESAVRAAMMGPRYLHLATHGFAEVSGGRLDAGLVLAPSPGSAHDSEDDGVLELFEIHRLALGSDLAVLSACETGKGMRVAGEGAFALSRGFLAAGTRRVVASLWAVDDEPTSRVVGTLFETIAASEHAGHAPSPALALRDAKRNVRENPQWADPFYWAAFVLSGR